MHMQFSQRRLHLRAGIHQAQNQAPCTQSVFETRIHRAGIAGYTEKMLTVVKFMPVLLKARDFTALQLTSKQNIPLPKPRFHAGFFFCLFFHFFLQSTHKHLSANENQDVFSPNLTCDVCCTGVKSSATQRCMCTARFLASPLTVSITKGQSE